jgi:hypothetical protein
MKNNARVLTPPDCQTYYKATAIKTDTGKKTDIQPNETTQKYILPLILFRRVPNSINKVRIVFSKMALIKLDVHMYKNEFGTHIEHHIQKSTSSGFKT